jgi:hypothetical protein
VRGETRLALATYFEAQVLLRGEEVAARELPAEQPADEFHAPLVGVVLDRVARLVTVEEGEMPAALEFDRPDVDVLQPRLRAAVPGEREFDEGAAL